MGRVDFLWRKRRTIGEADGRGKYADDGRSLWNEKRREDRLRELGFEVVRWAAADLSAPGRLGERVRAAFGRAERRSR